MSKLQHTAFILVGCAMGLIAASGDETFAQKAAQGGMAEVKLGQLAAGKAKDPKVKAFGQKMADDHSKAGEELMSIARGKSLTLPPDISAKDKDLVNRLSKLSGDSFDKAYMSAMVKDHETDVADFEKEANSGTDSELKSFAAKTLPTLREHLRLAKDAAASAGTN